MAVIILFLFIGKIADSQPFKSLIGDDEAYGISHYPQPSRIRLLPDPQSSFWELSILVHTSI